VRPGIRLQLQQLRQPAFTIWIPIKMTQPSTPLLLNDEDLEALEEVLVSDAVPDECMDLEMLDGFLAGVLLSPTPIATNRWLPEVWSAYGEESDFGGGADVQRAIQLVLAYYNEIATTLGREDEDERWEPFCFALDDQSEGFGLGDEWIDGFVHGLELWPEDWPEGLPDELVDTVQEALQETIEPWDDEEAAAADEETRLAALAAAGEVVHDIYLGWRGIGLPAPQPLALDVALASTSGPGRNEPCPCGSGKKYKKCCGAEGGD
jgi:uncharacterized protein